jgi:hypothetical protein
MISRVQTPRLGKYMLRPLHAKLVWTHHPVTPETPGDLADSLSCRLVVGNLE